MSNRHSTYEAVGHNAATQGHVVVFWEKFSSPDMTGCGSAGLGRFPGRDTVIR
jgi:hypothetical protein